MSEYEINLTFGYKNSDLKRKYTFGVDSVDGAALVAKVKAINASLSGGTDGGLGEFFRAEDNSPFNAIIAAESSHETATNIPILEEAD